MVERSETITAQSLTREAAVFDAFAQFAAPYGGA